MQFLTALLAFAAVMALMSTIVAVVIEAIINVCGMRSAGLRRLLESYYRTAVEPRLPPGSDASMSPRSFAAEVTANPSHQPSLFAFGPRRFNHLTTRQLVEQVARTKVGAAFLALDDAQLRPHLEALAYEFDRFSDGARDFFTRRTRNVSVLVALILAFALNIDAIRLYRVLATDKDTRDRVVALTQERVTVDADGRQTVVSGEISGENLTEDQFDQLISTLASMSIPIGYSQYPFCSRYSPLLGEVEEGEAVFDPRCERVNDHIATSGDAQNVAGAADAEPPGYFETTFAMPADGGAPMLDRAFARQLDARIDGDTVLWFFSVLIAGGMIGLGAPFWFNVYRRLGLLIPLVGAASALAGARPQPTQGGEVAPTTPTPGRRDDANARQDLVAAARIAAGESPPVPETTPSAATAAAPNITGYSPPGGPIGPSSAERVLAATAVTNGTAEPLRVRRLRG